MNKCPINSTVYISDIQDRSLSDLRDYLLHRLETRVGDRDKQMELLSPEYHSSDTAPYIIFQPPNKHLLYLGKNTKRYPQQRFFQMAHMIVRVLRYCNSPVCYAQSTCLEIGFSIFNAIVECKRLVPEYDATSGADEYMHAYETLCKIGDDNKVFDFVKEIREKGFELSGNEIEVKDFLNERYLQIWSEDEIDYLLGQFYIPDDRKKFKRKTSNKKQVNNSLKNLPGKHGSIEAQKIEHREEIWQFTQILLITSILFMFGIIFLQGFSDFTHFYIPSYVIGVLIGGFMIEVVSVLYIIANHVFKD